MVEGRRIPGRGRVTGGAVVVETVRHMIRVGHSREISLVTGVAISRCVDISGRVARNAGCGDVRPGQREAGSGMTEIGR